MHGSSSSRERLKDNFSDDDGLNGESWQKAQIKDDPFSLLDFLTKHMKALSVKAVKIGAAAVIGMLFLVILIVVMTVGGGCEDKEGSEWCEERKDIGLCESKSLVEWTDMELKCRKTCGFCGDVEKKFKKEKKKVVVPKKELEKKEEFREKKKEQKQEKKNRKGDTAVENCEDRRPSAFCMFAKNSGRCPSVDSEDADAVQMKKRCKATCGLCEGPASTQKKCKSKNKEADKWCEEKKHYCLSSNLKNFNIMKNNCKKTCGICDGRYQSLKEIMRKLSKEANCKLSRNKKSKNKECIEKKHLCDSSEEMQKDCKMTCGICKKTRKEKKPDRKKNKAEKAQEKAEKEKFTEELVEELNEEIEEDLAKKAEKEELVEELNERLEEELMEKSEAEVEAEIEEEEEAEMEEEEEEETADDETDQPFSDAILKRHNELRANHDAPPMTWSEPAALLAKNWCSKLAEQGQTEHNPDADKQGYGENLYVGGGVSKGALLGTSVTDMFYTEEKLYDYSNPEFQYQAGHFTAMVWKSTKEMGCSYANS